MCSNKDNLSTLRWLRKPVHSGLCPFPHPYIRPRRLNKLVIQQTIGVTRLKYQAGEQCLSVTMHVVLVCRPREALLLA